MTLDQYKALYGKPYSDNIYSREGVRTDRIHDCEFRANDITIHIRMCDGQVAEIYYEKKEHPYFMSDVETILRENGNGKQWTLNESSIIHGYVTQADIERRREKWGQSLPQAGTPTTDYSWYTGPNADHSPWEASVRFYGNEGCKVIGITDRRVEEKVRNAISEAWQR